MAGHLRFVAALAVEAHLAAGLVLATGRVWRASADEAALAVIERVAGLARSGDRRAQRRVDGVIAMQVESARSTAGQTGREQAWFADAWRRPADARLGARVEVASRALAAVNRARPAVVTGHDPARLAVAWYR